MTEKQTFDERSHGSGIRNADHGTGSKTQELPASEHDQSADAPYVDPAEEVMNTNPNISPPIHPKD